MRRIDAKGRGGKLEDEMVAQIAFAESLLRDDYPYARALAPHHAGQTTTKGLAAASELFTEYKAEFEAQRRSDRRTVFGVYDTAREPVVV